MEGGHSVRWGWYQGRSLEFFQVGGDFNYFLSMQRLSTQWGSKKRKPSPDYASGWYIWLVGCIHVIAWVERTQRQRGPMRYEYLIPTSAGRFSRSAENKHLVWIHFSLYRASYFILNYFQGLTQKYAHCT